MAGMVLTSRVATVATYCDRCPSRAQVYAHRAGGDLVLTFCGHHGAEHTIALIREGWTVSSIEAA